MLLGETYWRIPTLQFNLETVIAELELELIKDQLTKEEQFGSAQRTLLKSSGPDL